METDLLEIIELPDGEIALRRLDDEGSTLVEIRFSPESEHRLQGMKMEVARAMIEAGMHAYAELNMMAEQEDNEELVVH